MIEHLKSFSQSAKELSRNPLGIIALFIVLVYGFACLLFGFSADTLLPDERSPIIWFVILFPMLVLILFVWMVVKHHDKLYAPKDYRDDESFLKTLNQRLLKNVESAEESEKNIKDLMQYGEGFKIITEQEERIKQDLKKRSLDFTGNTAKVLIRNLAASQVINWFEKTYNTLFGSQITLLKHLNVTPEGTSYEFASNFFSDVKNQYPNQLSTWTLEQYLQYPTESGLLEHRENKLFIKQTGIEFLTLLTKSGYTESKIL
jgi:hypothetical protein